MSQRTLTRFIPGEEIDAVAQWNFDAVDTEALEAAAKARAAQQERDQLQDTRMRQDGYAEGFAQGFAQGQAHAIVEEQHKFEKYVQEEAGAKAERFAQLFTLAEQQLKEAEQIMSQGVMDLALALARQVVRQELSINPNVLQPVVREALGLLMADSKAAVVRLHPLDIEVFQDALTTEFASVSLTLVADSSIAPGGCVVSSAGTVVDGRLATRWRRAVATLGVDEPWEEPPHA